MINSIQISIIIVNYNSFNLLTQCLDSLIKFTKDVSYEIIVVDNNSTEGNIDDVLSKYDNIKLTKNSKNVGFGAANNQAMKAASGKYVLFLNNDTIFIENTIKKVYDFAESLTEPAIVGCKLLNEDGTLQLSVYNFQSISRQLAATFFIDQMLKSFNKISKFNRVKNNSDTAIEVEAIMGAFFFLRKDMFLKVNGFDDRLFFYYEDIDLCYQLKKINCRTIFFPDTAIFHIGGASAEKDSWFSMKNRTIARIQFAQKNFSGIYKWLYIFTEYFGRFYKILIFFLVSILTFNKNYLRKAWFNIKLLFIYPRNKFK